MNLCGWNVAVRSGGPAERSGESRAMLWLSRPWRLEAVAAAYFAAREAYAEHLAREAGLEILRNWSCLGGMLFGVCGTPDRVAAYAETLAGHGIGGFRVEVYGEVDPAALARIERARRLLCPGGMETEGEVCDSRDR
ncbi:MAG: hypothetical protein AB1609_15305 [Bacillota bacterium]